MADSTRNSPMNNSEWSVSLSPTPLLKTKSCDKLKFKDKQMVSMNTQADVQAIFIALLSQHCTLSLGRPHRQSYKTKQFMKIKDIQFNRFDTINVLQIIQVRSKEQEHLISEKENTTQKTAKRRTQLMKRRECVRLLQDLLVEFGFIVCFEKETVDGFEGQIDIYQNGIKILDTKQIRESGNAINKHLANLLASSKSVIVNKDTFAFDNLIV
ncbi:hypothetical protein EIN_177970 [Entamoeba invadens IP1]|uniref:hypothetical protein n=1 Tax=Entamoeba invadens IP1 TaxID=370355 RepID=UPI0002C3ED1D|nr:hypothetical protein EIN_177970 [Entamoeba invadens IP1]ELP93890.1 hypothetical protein EIN_177970 [Entamoeba invadens IP1]|eukprot:XP_004260661.1 hypothetical protein EIN_177970 [Entamoeba invadens IP1]